MPNMFGKKGEEYVRFERWILILIVMVFALRLGLSLAGVPNNEMGERQLGSAGWIGLLRCCSPDHRIWNL